MVQPSRLCVQGFNISARYASTTGLIVFQYLAKSMIASKSRRPPAMSRTLPLSLLTLIVFHAASISAADDRPAVLVADFEGADYGSWKATGQAFGPGPARGTLPNQMPVTGYCGEGLVNSFFKGDGTTGTLTSPKFKIERKRINFLIGGGGYAEKTCINLRIGDKIVRTATGPNTTPGGSEHLAPHSWDVAEVEGQSALIEIVDDATGGWGHINVDHIEQSDLEPPVPDERHELLDLAETSVRKAVARAAADPDRPVFHVLPVANWLNDPNGPIFHNGYYHLFFQHNPFGDEWGHMHWAHVRSKDLAHWEHLPIALWPSRSKNEAHIFSGCAVKRPDGKVMLVYTSVGGRLPEQWAAEPEDDDLLRWKKHDANPVLTEAAHGSTKVHEWRDPYIFRVDDQFLMVVGGNLNASQGGQGVVNVYRAEDDSLAKWKYLGVLFQHPDANVKNIECPLFFQVGTKWVLIVSPHRSPEWFVGDLNLATMKFTPRQRGVVDPGHFYAPNVLQEDSGRRVMWGWVNGFPGGRGWLHCLTLPRILSVTDNDRLVQQPAPELAKLRGPKLDSATMRGDALELVAEIEPRNAKAYGLRLRAPASGSGGIAIRCDATHLDIGGTRVPLPRRPDQPTVKLHVFLDRSLVEVFADDGRICVSRVFTPDWQSNRVEFFSEGGSATLRSLDAWPIKTIW